MPRHLWSFFPSIAILLLLAMPTPSQADLPLGSRPPAFIGPASNWINSPPLSWPELKGKVV